MNIGRRFLLGLLIFCLRGAGFASQETLNDPYQILTKHYTALGGMDKIKAEKTSYIEGTLVIKGAGIQGVLKQWEATPLRHRQELDLKVLRQTEGDNGRFSWVMDTNGKIQLRQDEATQKRRKVKELLETFDHLNRTSSNFTISFEGIQKVGEADCYVVKISNKINQDLRLEFIDRTTFLLVKSIDKQPDEETQTLYSDYRDVNGIKRAFKHEIEILPIGQKIEIQFSRYESNVPIDSALFEPPQSDIQDFKFLKGESAESIPFKFIENHLFIPVEINGKEKLWCLDTGAEMSAIGSDFASELGLTPEGKIKGSGAGRTVDISFVTLPAYRISGIQFNKQRIACVEVKGLIRNMFEIEVVGILGYDFLSRFVIRIDYAAEKLSFYHPEKFVYKGDGTVLDAPLKNNTFAVAGTVDGKYTGTWSLDLGAGGCSFHYPFAEENGLLTLSGVDRRGLGAGGEFKEREVQFRTLEFAGFIVRNPLIDVTLEKGEGAFGRKELIGNLGNTLFRHFVIYLDYKRQRIIVEKGRDFDRQFPGDKSGLQVVLTDKNEIAVFFVSPNTPAEKAGFRKGDIIPSINGTDVKSMGGIIPVRQLFKKDAGTQYRISVLRQGKKEELKLVLRNLH